MRTRNLLALRNRILVADLLWAILAAGLAHKLHFLAQDWATLWDLLFPLVPFLLVAALLWALLFFAMKLECFHGGWSPRRIISDLLLAVGLFFLVVLLTIYIAGHNIPAPVLIYYAALLWAGFVLIRWGARLILLAHRRAGDMQRVVIIGDGPIAVELQNKLEHHPEMLCQVVGILAPAEVDLNHLPLPGNGRRPAPGAATVPTVALPRLMREHGVDELILALPNSGSREVLNLIGSFRRQGMAVSFVPSLMSSICRDPSCWM